MTSLASALLVANVIFSVFKATSSNEVTTTIPVSVETAYEAANEWCQSVSGGYFGGYSFPANCEKQELMCSDEKGDRFVGGYAIIGPWITRKNICRYIIVFTAGCPRAEASLCEMRENDHTASWERYKKACAEYTAMTRIEDISMFNLIKTSEYRNFMSSPNWRSKWNSYMDSKGWNTGMYKMR